MLRCLSMAGLGQIHEIHMAETRALPFGGIERGALVVARVDHERGRRDAVERSGQRSGPLRSIQRDSASSATSSLNP